MLEMRNRCERCNADLAADAKGALICSFECTWCETCGNGALAGACPNCGGALSPRPPRPTGKLQRPPVTAATAGDAGPTPKGVRWIQNGLAATFLGLGGWCLLAPGMVERLALRPEFVADTLASHVLMGCFGAQAVLCGLLILLCRFTRHAFLVFGLAASLPFIGFNVYFYFIEPVFTPLMLLDFAGNLVILTLCLLGASMLPKDHR